MAVSELRLIEDYMEYVHQDRMGPALELVVNAC